jgi:hypothetical protein
MPFRLYVCLLLLLCSTFFPRDSYAQYNDKNLGIGIALLSPTGFSIKYHLTRENAVDGALGWSIDDFQAHADYLIIERDLHSEQGIDLDMHYGVGGRILLRKDHKHNDPEDPHRYRRDDKDEVGFRFPIGLDVFLPKPNIELFAEIALVINFYQDTDAELEATFGGRYYL